MNTDHADNKCNISMKANLLRKLEGHLDRHIRVMPQNKHDKGNTVQSLSGMLILINANLFKKLFQTNRLRNKTFVD